MDLIRAETARRNRQQRDVSRNLVTNDVEAAVTNVLIAEQIRGVVDTLPVDERAAIELAYFQGLTYIEVARYLEVPEGTIKSRIRNGLKTMHAHLERSGYSRKELGL